MFLKKKLSGAWGRKNVLTSQNTFKIFALSGNRESSLDGTVALAKKSYMGPYMTCIYASHTWIFGIYGQPIFGEVLYGTIYGTIYFFSNKAVIKIDMNLHKNVIIPISTTSFIKLQLDFTRISQKYQF